MGRQGGAERFGKRAGDAYAAQLPEASPGAGAEIAVGEPGPHGEQESLVDLVAAAESDVEPERLTILLSGPAQPFPGRRGDPLAESAGRR
jgi:hypothetical protein